jgi:solute carrier family 35 (UDP-galactose transporter), member B1
VLTAVLHHEQHIRISSFYMMYRVNQMCVVFHLLYLLAGFAVQGNSSEIVSAVNFCKKFPEVQQHLLLFCLCAAVGQCFIFYLIKEFGSLVNVTITITRKFFSILISVVLFAHPVAYWQWFGIVSVFAGLMYQPLERALTKKRVQTIEKKEK